MQGQELINKHRDMVQNQGFKDKVFSYCESKLCKGRHVQAHYIDKDRHLWCRACHNDALSRTHAISTFTDLTPEKIIEELGLEEIKQKMSQMIEKYQIQMVDQVHAKAKEFKKCIVDMKPTAYMDIIKKLISSTEKICGKTQEDVKGDDIYQLQKVCDQFDQLVRFKNDSQDVKRLQKVINSFKNFKEGFVQQLDDVLDSLPIPGHKVRAVRASSWHDIAVAIQAIQQPVNNFKLHNESNSNQLSSQ